MASPLNLYLIIRLKFNGTRIYFRGKSRLEIAVSLDRRILILERIDNESELSIRIYTSNDCTLDVLIH